MDIIHAADVDEVIAISGADFSKRIIDPLRNVLNHVESLRTRVLIPDVPHIVMRDLTLQALLESFLDKLGRKEFREAMLEGGELVGMSFADNLIGFLMDIGKLPDDVELLMNIWTAFDTNAGWGTFTTSVDKNRIKVTIEDSFVTRGLEKDVHRNCSFLEGYIRGLLWGMLKQYYRWYKHEVKLAQLQLLEPKNVSHSGQPSEAMCTFEVELIEEELKEAFDLYYEATMAIRNNELPKAAQYLRSCLEYALKQKMGIEEEKVSLVVILNALKKSPEILKGRILTLADNIYGRTSDIIHAPDKFSPTKQRYLSWLGDASIILKILEQQQLSETQKEAVRKNIKEIRRETKNSEGKEEKKLIY